MLRHAPKLSLALAAALAPLAPAQTIRVRLPTHITLPGANPSPLIDGRLLVLLSTDPTDEPRMQINDTPNSQLVFGMTLDGAQPGSTVTLSPDAQGYPIASLAAVPPGDYTLQVVLNLYETFHRADGKTIKLAPDRGEGQHWNLAPGNPLSTPQKIHLAAAAAPHRRRPQPHHPAHPPGGRHPLHPPPPHTEPAPHQVLGNPRLPLRHRPRPRGL